VEGDLDTPYSTLAHIPEAEFQATRFYQEWVEPQGLRDACITKFAQADSIIGLFSVVTAATRDIISAEERRVIQLLSPHLRRAAMIGNMLDQKSIALAAYQSALGALSSAVLLTDANGGVRYRNAAADALFGNGGLLSVVNGTLNATLRVADPALSEAIRRAATDRGATLGDRGIGIPLSRPGEPPVVAYVLPLAASDVRVAVGTATVAVFVSHADTHVAPADSVLMKLFDLTQTEARVMVRAGRGRSASEIAAELGISENTVKTHLSRTYAKTGTTRQAELVDVLASISRS
jgi:DNA-binding CsgD family transcriptional regulator